MLCAYLALRMVFDIEKGVGMETMRLSAVMDGKLKSKLVKTGIISIEGALKSNESEEALLSDPLKCFQTGKIDLIL